MNGDSMKLTPRLKTIADMVEYSTMADIGTDHGKIPVYLVKNNICSLAAACDINEGPVSACIKNIDKYGLSEKISPRLADGLKGIKAGEFQTIIIAGMGGELISRIINDSLEIAKYAEELILQPMTGAEKLKTYLAETGFKILDEKLATEKDKIYLITKVKFDKPYNISFREKYVSNAILNSESELLKEYIRKILKNLNDKLKGKNGEETERFNELIRFLEGEYENI